MSAWATLRLVAASAWIPLAGLLIALSGSGDSTMASMVIFNAVAVPMVFSVLYAPWYLNKRHERYVTRDTGGDRTGVDGE